MDRRQWHEPYPRRPDASPDTGQDRTMAPDPQNRVLLENYFLPGALEAQFEAFIDHYNHRRYYESICNVTPADAYYGVSTKSVDTIVDEELGRASRA